jgi:hypothetical protein
MPEEGVEPTLSRGELDFENSILFAELTELFHLVK